MRTQSDRTRRDISLTTCRATLVATLVIIAGVVPVVAAPSTDGVVFRDDFTGSSLDLAKWIPQTNGLGTSSLTVTGGTMNITSNTTATRYIRSVGIMDFSLRPTAWTAEVAFTVNADMITTATRQNHLLTGVNDSVPSSYFVRGFDLRLVQGASSGTFNIEWWGYNSNPGEVNLSSTPIPLMTGLSNGVPYIVKVYRKPDNTFDIFLNGAFVINKPYIHYSIISSVNPTALVIGDSSGAPAMNVTFDNVTVNLLPEPTSGVMLIAAVAGVLRRRTRSV